MAIQIECGSCHTKLKAKDEHAGKRVACPKCKTPIPVPQAPPPEDDGELRLADEPAESTKPFSQPKVASAPIMATVTPAAPAASGTSDLGDMLDDWNSSKQSSGDDDGYGLAKVSAHEHCCPMCSREMKPGAVLCIHCGYHTGTGQRMKTKREISAVGPASKSSPFVDGDATIMGLPMIPVLVGAGAVLLLGVALYFIFPVGLLLMCLFGGMALMFVGNIWMLIIAFQEDVVQGLLVWFIPFYALYYLITRWEAAQYPFYASLAGGGLFGLAMMIAASLGEA